MSDWNRKLWGVELTGADGSKSLIGCAWRLGHKPTPYPGEPTRALLFTTRAVARECCASMMAQWSGGDAILRSWKVRPVRVVETVRKVKP